MHPASDPDPKPGDTTDEPDPIEPRDDDASDPGDADTVTISGDNLVVTEDDGEP